MDDFGYLPNKGGTVDIDNLTISGLFTGDNVTFDTVDPDNITNIDLFSNNPLITKFRSGEKAYFKFVLLQDLQFLIFN